MVSFLWLEVRIVSSVCTCVSLVPQPSRRNSQDTRWASWLTEDVIFSLSRNRSPSYCMPGQFWGSEEGKEVELGLRFLASNEIGWSSSNQYYLCSLAYFVDRNFIMGHLFTSYDLPGQNHDDSVWKHWWKVCQHLDRKYTPIYFASIGHCIWSLHVAVVYTKERGRVERRGGGEGEGGTWCLFFLAHSMFATGSCDGTTRIWRFKEGGWVSIVLRVPGDEMNRYVTSLWLLCCITVACYKSASLDSLVARPSITATEVIAAIQYFIVISKASK